jgi:hypothetical protein
MRASIITVALAAALSGCGAGGEPVLGSEESLCVVRPHCNACVVDPSSSTGGSRTCFTCDGDNYKVGCKATCPHHVVNVAGATLPNLSVVNAYWGSWAPNLGDAVAHQNTWHALGPAPDFWSRMSEYGIGQGSYYGGFFAHSDLAANPTDQEIRDELTAEIFGPTGGLPSPGAQTLYMVFLPQNVRSTRSVAAGSTGYHDSFIARSTRIYYAVLDGVSDAATVDLVAAHEVEEAATDAILGQGFNLPGAAEGEIADLCAPRNEVIAGHLVPTVWSQAICGCR